MKRRDEAGRAERGPFSTGLAGQAAKQAGSQAQSSIYAQMPPSSCFTDYTSAQPDVLFWVKITWGKGGEEKERFPDLLPTIMSRLHSRCLLHSLSSLNSSASNPDATQLRLSKMPDVKDSPSICLCLSPAFFAFCPSPSLFRITLCIFHLLVVTLSNDSIYFRKQCPIYFELGKGKEKETYAVVILSAISIFSVIISNIKRKKETTVWQCFELFAKHKAKIDVAYSLSTPQEGSLFFFFLYLFLNSPSTLIWSSWVH